MESANYSTWDLVIHTFGNDAVEIKAVLMATSVDGTELDKITHELAELPYITQAFWSPSTTE